MGMVLFDGEDDVESGVIHLPAGTQLGSQRFSEDGVELPGCGDALLEHHQAPALDGRPYPVEQEADTLSLHVEGHEPYALESAMSRGSVVVLDRWGTVTE